MSLLTILATMGSGKANAITPPSGMTKLTGLGDSIMDDGAHTKTTMIAQAASVLGVPYTVHGHSGWQAIDMNGFIATEIIPDNPSHCVLEGGINDIDQNRTTTQIVNSYQNKIEQLVAANITPIVFLVLPWTNATTAKSRQIDTINTQLIALASNYPTAKVADARPQLSEFRVGGDAGNLWNQIAIYGAGDGLHWNNAGTVIMGNVIAALF